jgi:hypothetical protein
LRDRVSGAGAQSLQIESIGALTFLVEHDLFAKSVSTFPDHAPSVT